MWRRAMTAIAVSSLSSAVACSLLVSTDGLDDGPGPSGDAAAERTNDDGPIPDAPTEASADASSEANVFIGGESRCGLSSFRLCDGFETDSGIWGNPARINGQRAARGAKSYHVALPLTDGGRLTDYVAAVAPLAFPTSGIFVRAFVYVPSGQFVPNTGVLWVYKNAEPYPGADLGFANGKLRIRAVSGSGALKISSTAIPLDRWACLELEVFPNDATTGGARAWLDDQPLTDITLENGVDTTAPDVLEFGVEASITSTTSGFDMWIDEATADLARIGCSR